MERTQLDNAASEEAGPRAACVLEGDLYTMAFVSFCELPTKHPKARAPMKVWSICLMFLVAAIQVLMIWTVYLHVKNDLIESKNRPLQTAYEMIVGSNITVPLHTVEDLCGQWEDQEMQDDIAFGPLRTIKMPDGTVYGPNADYSLFYNIKQPTRSWDYGRYTSERSVLDDVLFVISEGVSLNPFTPSGYSVLFIMMLAMLFFSIFVEFRKIYHWFCMLAYVPRKTTDGTTFQAGQNSLAIVALSREAVAAGIFATLCRLAGSFGVAALGTVFLFYTTLKIDLIMNGLALLFILELDKAIYLATVPHPKQELINSIEPVQYGQPGGLLGSCSRIGEWAVPVFVFPLNFALAMLMRSYQVDVFKHYFRMTSAICLFAGPTPGGIDFRLDLMGPVAGFCDSLLGTTCAPGVEPAEAAETHGYCVITDQTTMSEPTVQFYLDDPKVFANRYTSDGAERSWVEWGEADPSLYSSKLWMDGPYQNILRKNCLQMYQKEPPNDLEVDDDSGETMDGAPFWCGHDDLFDAVFGPVEKAGRDGKPTMKAMDLVRGLGDPYVVSVIDRCKFPKNHKVHDKSHPEPLKKQGDNMLESVNSLSDHAHSAIPLAGLHQHRRHAETKVEVIVPPGSQHSERVHSHHSLLHHSHHIQHKKHHKYRWAKHNLRT